MSVSKRTIQTNLGLLTPHLKFDKNSQKENDRNVNQSLQKIMSEKVSYLLKAEQNKGNDQKIKILTQNNQEQIEDLQKQLELFKVNMSKDQQDKQKQESKTHQFLNTDRRALKKAEEVVNANIRRNLFESLWSKSKRRVRSADISPIKFCNLHIKANELLVQNSIKQRSQGRFEISDVKLQKKINHVEFQTPVLSQTNKKRYEKTPFPKNELQIISQTSSSKSE